MIVALTGASGHVGINLCKSLIEQGYNIKALSHRNENRIGTLPLTLIPGDVLDKESLRPLLTDADVVFHLAARISISGDQDGMVHRVNTEGTRNMVAMSSECRVKRFIHFSSIHAVSQFPLDTPLDESRPLVTHQGFAYDRSKAEGERAVVQAARDGLNALVLSPTAIIGPDDPEPSLSGKAVIDLYNRKIPALVPGGYNWVDVRDVVAAAVAAIDKGSPGEKYLLSGQWYNLKEISGIIGSLSGRRTVSTVIPMWLARTGLPFIDLYSRLSGTVPLYTGESLKIISEGNRLISNEKAKKELGFNPRSLTDTIRDFLPWLKGEGFIH